MHPAPRVPLWAGPGPLEPNSLGPGSGRCLADATDRTVEAVRAGPRRGVGQPGGGRCRRCVSRCPGHLPESVCVLEVGRQVGGQHLAGRQTKGAGSRIRENPLHGACKTLSLHLVSRKQPDGIPVKPAFPGPRSFYACRAIRLYEATTPRLHSGQPLFAVCRPVCAWQIGRPTASYFANSISLGFRTAAARDCEAGTAKKGGWAGSGDGAGAEECCSAGRRYMCTELPTGFPVSRVPDVQIRVAGGGAGGGGRVVGAMNK